VSVLDTPRLRLRLWRDDDLDGIARMNADPRVSRWLTPTGAPMSRGASEAAFERWRAHWDEHGFGIWAVEERETGGLVGRLGLQYHRLWPHEPEVGWMLDPRVWGKGYATESGAAALRHAFEMLGCDRVVSIVHPENAPSIRVAERLGEQPYATVRWDEGDLDLVVYAVGRDDWARLQSTA
jgi:RimJ/RimL family protein N-acetyltransferase